MVHPLTIQARVERGPPPMPQPPAPDPDIMPTLWRLPLADEEGCMRWVYFRRGAHEVTVEWTLAQRHAECLEVAPPDEAEMVRVRRIARSFNN